MTPRGFKKPMGRMALLSLISIVHFSAQAVIGGQAVTSGEFPTVLGLEKDGKIFCSALGITPRLVLTAAHCIKDVAGMFEGKSKEYLETVKVYRGEGGGDEIVSGQHRLAKAKVHPMYRDHPLGEGDIGYLLLKEPLPEKAYSSDLLLKDRYEILRYMEERSTVHVVGFGLNSNVTLKSGGVKRAGLTHMTGYNSHEALIGDNDVGACAGDSGGPAFVKTASGQYKSLGLAIKVAAPHGFFGTSCAVEGPATYTLIHDSICWVKESSGVEIPGLGFSCQPEPESGAYQEISYSDSLLGYCHGLRHPDKIWTLAVLFKKLNVQSCGELADKALEVRELDLSSSLLSDLELLGYFPHLEDLSLRDNQIESVAPLSNLKSLRNLDLSWNWVSKKQFQLLSRELFRAQVEGKWLQFYNYQKTRFWRLCTGQEETTPAQKKTIKAVMHSLAVETCDEARDQLRIEVVLDLSEQGLSDLTPLRGLTDLRLLYLSGNQIQDISVVSRFKKLRQLDIRDNQIKSLDAIQDLAELEAVNAENNQIESLPEMNNFAWIGLSGNPICEIDPGKCQ